MLKLHKLLSDRQFTFHNSTFLCFQKAKSLVNVAAPYTESYVLYLYEV